METSIRKWGNSAGVVLPQNALKECGAQVGDTVKISVSGKEIVLSVVRSSRDINSLIHSITAANKHIDLRFIAPERSF